MNKTTSYESYRDEYKSRNLNSRYDRQANGLSRVWYDKSDTGNKMLKTYNTVGHNSLYASIKFKGF